MSHENKTGARIPVLKTYKLYIGGKFPRTESGRYFASKDHEGGFVANICRGSRKDFRNAVVAARKAQGGWASRTAFNRGQILYRMAEMLESRAASFRLSLEEIGGYSREDARAEVEASVDRLIWYAGWTDKFAQVFGGANPVASSHFNVTTPEPCGVVSIVAPEKSPLLGLVSAIAPIIASGNTCVVAADTPIPTLAIDLAEVFATSDLPGGVVNLITCHRDELIPHMAKHMDVDALMIFGASRETRRDVSLEAAESVKRVKFMADCENAQGWLSDECQSPYWMLPFVEFKTAWHPLGR